MSDLTAGQVDALLMALREARGTSVDPEGAMTTRELCEHFGRGEKVVRRWIETLKREGRIQVVTVRRTRLDNETRPITAYRLVA